MKKGITVVAAATLLAGCVSTSDRLEIKDSASLRAESTSIIARPTEYGAEELGTASGSASGTTILGFIHTGDSEETKFSIFGNRSGDPLEGTAAFRAATEKGGDAFYQVTAHTEVSGIPFLYRTKTVRVSGKVLKLKYLGPLTEERADKLRAAASQNKSK